MQLCTFSHFFNFSISFYPIWMKIISKFSENVGLHAYCLSLVLNRSFLVFLQEIGRTGLLVRLNQLQSDPVLGPTNQTWSTNIVNWSTKCVFGGQEEVAIRQSHDFFTFSKNLKKIRQIEKKINLGSKKKGCDAWLTNWLNWYSSLMTQWTGNEHKNMEKVFLGVITWLFDSYTVLLFSHITLQHAPACSDYHYSFTFTKSTLWHALACSNTHYPITFI